MVRDLELMKQNNINTVRTSHYRMFHSGMIFATATDVIGEANVEAHEMGAH
jgi:beta-galactosidase